MRRGRPGSEKVPRLGTSRQGIPWVTYFYLHRCSTRTDGDPRREVPKPTISRYQTRCAQVGCSARARARPRAREPPESEFRELTEMLSTTAVRTSIFGGALPAALYIWHPVRALRRARRRRAASYRRAARSHTRPATNTEEATALRARSSVPYV